MSEAAGDDWGSKNKKKKKKYTFSYKQGNVMITS